MWQAANNGERHAFNIEENIRNVVAFKWHIRNGNARNRNIYYTFPSTRGFGDLKYHSTATNEMSNVWQ